MNTSRKISDMFNPEFSVKKMQEEAARETTIKIAKNLLKIKIPIKTISIGTGLDEEFVKKLSLDIDKDIN